MNCFVRKFLAIVFCVGLLGGSAECWPPRVGVGGLSCLGGLARPCPKAGFAFKRPSRVFSQMPVQRFGSAFVSSGGLLQVPSACHWVKHAKAGQQKMLCGCVECFSALILRAINFAVFKQNPYPGSQEAPLVNLIAQHPDWVEVLKEFSGCRVRKLIYLIAKKAGIRIEVDVANFSCHELAVMVREAVQKRVESVKKKYKDDRDQAKPMSPQDEVLLTKMVHYIAVLNLLISLGQE